MPKTNVEMARESMVRKRQRAREAGLCCICCKRQPNLGRKVCTPCNAANIERRRRQRKRDREVTQVQRVIVALEVAGDLARDHHLYEDAAHRYQDILNMKAIDSSEDARISEKLARVLSLSANPQAAAPLFDNVLNSYLHESVHAEKTIELLLQQARQRWLDKHTEDALPLIAQAVRIADMSGIRKLRTLTRARMANYLLGLTRYDEARDLLQSYGDILPDEDMTIVSIFSTQKAIIAAAYGEKEQAIIHFERAIATAKDDPDPLQCAAVWQIHSAWMLTLGEAQVARASSERAISLARQWNIPWLVQIYCLQHADKLFLFGEYEKAHECFVQALAYEVDAPLATEILASSGLLIALRAHDTAIVSRITQAFDPEALFKTDPVAIAALVTVFSHWHVMEGRSIEAEKLLHRAVSVLAPVKHFSDFWNFPITVARYGIPSDFREARRIIETRATSPCSTVAQATLTLFDAYVAKREGRYRKAGRCAKDAARCFETLGWHNYVDLAKALLSSLLETKLEHKDERAFGKLAHVLTSREREVAALLHKNLTNQEIAEKLSISKHTVHTHVASILTRLGLQSRHQLANMAPDTNP